MRIIETSRFVILIRFALFASALLPGISNAEPKLTAFGGSRISVPSSTAVGTVIARHYFTPQELCGKATCEVTSSYLYNKGSFLGSRSGPDLETTVDGLSTRVLLDGVPLTNTLKKTVYNSIEVQLFRDSRTPKNGSLNPGSLNRYFSISYKTSIITTDFTFISFAVDVSFIDGTCSVPNQTIKLPDVSRTSFRGVGSTTGATPFSIPLVNCPSGYNRVGYLISPINGEISGIPGALALRPEATARGVGVKLTDANSRAPIPFNRSIQSPYKEGAPRIDIPLLAEYVQTEANVEGGSVSAGALILLDYQ
ncbi:fimbrial protein [Burkholderia sp. PU8-34]